MDAADVALPGDWTITDSGADADDVTEVDEPGADADAGETMAPEVSADVVPGPCLPEACGIACFDEAVCGLCGNLECDAPETPESCGVDCCEPELCNPAAGPPYPPGDDSCGGAPDGTPCSDGSVDNGCAAA